MHFFYTTLICFSLYFVGFSQEKEHPHVKLIEEKNGKRLDLFAVNRDTVPYIIFLRVTTSDYRRSSKRPVLKEIPKNSKELLKTLILLDGKQGLYDATFIVNDVATSMNIQKDHDNFELKIDDELRRKKVIMYSKQNGALCDDFKSILQNNQIPFDNFNFESDRIKSTLAKSLKLSEIQDNIELPVYNIDGTIYPKIKTPKKLVALLKFHFQ